jgi:hypothetical protein
MSALSQAVIQLNTVVGSPDTTPQAAMDALRAVFQAAQTSDRSEREKALPTLASLVESTNPVIASMIAICCGALVEIGTDPALAFDAVWSRIGSILPDAQAYLTLCQAEGAEPDDPQVMQRLGPEHPDEANAWNALGNFYRAAVAMLSRSKALRKKAHADTGTIELLAALSSAHGGADWLNQLLAVLDDEALIVLHPGEKRGYRVRIAGVGDNFQLHTLLADTLIGAPEQGWLPGQRPDPQVAANARDGAVEGLSAVGTFNLYNWDALDENGDLPAGQIDTVKWIWGEGIPADIRVFEGTRIILLGPPPYQRGWNAERRFSGMVGELEVIEKLAPETVQAWLDRLAAAK